MTIRAAAFAIYCFLFGSLGALACLYAIVWVAAGGMTFRATLACGALSVTMSAFGLMLKAGYDLVRR